MAGFLFLFILVLNVAMGALGYLMEKDDYDPDADLLKISSNPKRFRTGIALALTEHGCVIALALLLFGVFAHLNMMLGVVWAICRTGEGLIQFYNEPSYWRLLRTAGQYSGARGASKTSLSDSARAIFEAKERRFRFAMILWSIGTLAFSIVLIASGVAPQFVGWLGIIASVLIGFGTGMKLVRPELKVPPIGALFAILFEILIGGWLLFSSMN